MTTTSTGPVGRRTTAPAAAPPAVARSTADSRPAGPHGYSSHKDAHLKRLARIEGQVRGIARMVDEDKYCIDVLTQVSAVTKALQAVSLALLEEHLAHCVANAVAAGGDEGAAKLKEASDAIARLVRS
ncbi:MAG: metal-sensitive transcriptional regulator [Frankiales bacterium]|nr:metal-sensitive transcriptional regulator [Frankiales bacterium]